VRTAIEILEKHYISFVKKHYDKITHRLEISDEDLRDAIDEITNLNPKPGNSMNETSRPIEQVIPDFTLVHEGDEIRVLLNGRNAPELRLSKKYSDMLEEFSNIKGKPNKAQKEATGRPKHIGQTCTAIGENRQTHRALNQIGHKRRNAQTRAQGESNGQDC
ncbi:MAG: hypothetical protein EBR13_04640, partial [Rhodobacteraceae bacterium]|nr:hypothetical protein [Paracoccaceae bacterium]